MFESLFRLFQKKPAPLPPEEDPTSIGNILKNTKKVVTDDDIQTAQAYKLRYPEKKLGEILEQQVEHVTPEIVLDALDIQRILRAAMGDERTEAILARADQVLDKTTTVDTDLKEVLEHPVLKANGK